MKNKTWLMIAIAVGVLVIIIMIARQSGEPIPVPETTTTTMEDVLPVDGQALDMQGGDIAPEGDVIIEIEGQGLQKGKDLADYIYEYSIGSVINFKVVNGDQQKTVSYTVAEK